ncbi:hypothetical protein HPB52_005510 [Rhipicephalus sanguineus]|uniref:Acid phosphatase n=1 Tax=Rhipicephalus sanguineus TaxID=34632 RepID=A0A9D4PIX2_RHISA|nr:hypothetical protein HPB52_005510 [Rhipicephalus sanguineus]
MFTHHAPTIRVREFSESRKSPKASRTGERSMTSESVGGGAEWWQAGVGPCHRTSQQQFCAVPGFGDWGGLPFYPYTTRIQRNLAKTMAVVAAAKRIDFVLSLGDNFYFKGVRSVDDRRFKASAVFTTAGRL